jgi:hypothetical protein
MLIVGETFADRKADLLDYIKVCRQLITVINTMIKKHPDWDNDLAYEVMALEQQEIKRTMEEIIQLQRWYETEGKYV